MKKFSLFSFALLLYSFAFNQGICPKTYTAEIKTTYETLNFSDGEIEITKVVGGATPYSYQWSNGQSGGQNKISNLVAGQYNLTISDANGCPYKLCILLDKDSLPCSSALQSNICNQTINIGKQLWFYKKPNQTGVQIELYNNQRQLLTTKVTTSFTGGGFYTTLVNDLYYNNTYKIVSKGIYGTSVADFCDDTCSFTVQDFPCYYNWNANSCQDTLNIGQLFWVQKYPHMTKASIEIYDTNGNIIKTRYATLSSAAGFYTGLVESLYYEKNYSLVIKGIYNPGDTSNSCGDTCSFRTTTFPDSHFWSNNSCKDTISAHHALWVSNNAHLIGVKYNLFDSYYNLVNTWTSTNLYTGGVLTNLSNKVIPDSNYCIITQLIFKDTVNLPSIPDTTSFIDTCCFYVKANSSRAKNPQQNDYYELSSVSNTNKDFENDKIVIYPNPIKNTLNISSSHKLNQDEMAIYAIDGKKIEFKLLLNSETTGVIDVSKLKEGSYILLQQNKETSKQISFIVTR